MDDLMTGGEVEASSYPTLDFSELRVAEVNIPGGIPISLYGLPAYVICVSDVTFASIEPSEHGVILD